jgi:hypothetical protein
VIGATSPNSQPDRLPEQPVGDFGSDAPQSHAGAGPSHQAQDFEQGINSRSAADGGSTREAARQLAGATLGQMSEVRSFYYRASRYRPVARERRQSSREARRGVQAQHGRLAEKSSLRVRLGPAPDRCTRAGRSLKSPTRSLTQTGSRLVVGEEAARR